MTQMTNDGQFNNVASSEELPRPLRWLIIFFRRRLQSLTARRWHRSVTHPGLFELCKKRRRGREGVKKTKRCLTLTLLNCSRLKRWWDGEGYSICLVITGLAIRRADTVETNFFFFFFFATTNTAAAAAATLTAFDFVSVPNHHVHRLQY